MAKKAKKQKPFQVKQLNDKLRYRYIGKITLFTPSGILTNKYKDSHTGKEWKNILVYEFSEHTTTTLNKMFKQVKK